MSPFRLLAMTQQRILPLPRTVYITLAVMLCLQIPASLLITRGDIRSGLLVSQLLAIALPLVLVARWRGYDTHRLFPCAQPTWGTIGVAIVIALLLAMATDYLVALTDAVGHVPAAYETNLRRLVRVQSSTEAVEKFFLLCLLPAIVEECCFRGFCQTSLSAAYGARMGLIVTALLFAIAHANPWYLPLYFGIGLFLGALMQWRSTLWLPIVAHTVNNTWTYVTKVVDWKLPGL